jgi:hypothetical protein
LAFSTNHPKNVQKNPTPPSKKVPTGSSGKPWNGGACRIAAGEASSFEVYSPGNNGGLSAGGFSERMNE